MKAVGFNCSPRKDGNTAHMLKDVLSQLESKGIETDYVQVGGCDLHGCRACGGCARNKNMKCVLDDDIVNSCMEKMIAADIIIIGSPTYFADLTTEAKALIDRSGYTLRSNGNPLKRKIGAAVVSVRRCGGIHVFDSINHFFTINEMVVASSNYWNVTLARAPGDYDKDEEAIGTMKVLADNIAWLSEKLR